VPALCIIIGGFFLYKYFYSVDNYPTPYLETVSKYSEQYNVETPLIYAIMKAESNFDTVAISSAGAYGLMQILPTTGDLINITVKYPNYTSSLLLTTDCNIKFGTYFLRWLMNRPNLYDGLSYDNVIAAYNAGHSKVESWLANPLYSSDQKTLSVIPFDETASYVKTVNSYYYEYKKRLG
jgi:soluble lytic murein transglycosylase